MHDHIRHIDESASTSKSYLPLASTLSSRCGFGFFGLEIANGKYSPFTQGSQFGLPRVFLSFAVV